ncbi:type VI secretion system baseplate subunit TssF [Myroides odoratimimus]|uniref:type VI secretion system baseplate subunit TssF n=1 Tax=Myroides odoratimimus TaxID=76832 RepID=UPI003100DE66
MKKILNNYSKEVIKSRILQNAAKLWGVNNPNALDPFVSLLVDAFSTEIFKVNNDIEDIKAGILEKMARLLTPSIYTYPRPSHAIAIIEAEESKEVLLNHQEFFTKKLFTSNVKSASDIQIDIPFTAIDNINLYKLKVSFMLIGDTIWKYDRFYNSVPEVKLSSSIGHNTMFLAIDFSEYDLEHTPEHLSLYCDNPTYEHLEFVYKLLPFSSMSVKGEVLKIKEGLTYPDKEIKNGYEEMFDSYSIEHRIEENIKNIYSSKFIEISGLKDKVADLQLAVLPKELEFLKQQHGAKDILKNNNLLWIQIDFPAQYSKEILEGFTFHLNAFPVLNRGWKHNESSLDIMGNNIPLITSVGEEFLYTNKVVDSHAREYSEIPFSENNSLRQGLYTLRKGGMERFSERNAIDLITNVIELTRDEVSAFGIVERDKVMEALKNMIFQMRALDQKVKSVNGIVPSDVNYVIVEPLANTEYLNATYWITHCALANNIRKATELTQQNKVYTNVNRHILLLSNTQGGEREKTGTDAIQAYKYALTTRDKIISKEDIKNYCKMVLKQQCKEVNVSKGTIVSDKPKEGFIRTVNIEIVVSDYEELSSQYWISYAHSLKKQIVSRAIDGIEYVVSFKPDTSIKA